MRLDEVVMKEKGGTKILTVASKGLPNIVLPYRQFVELNIDGAIRASDFVFLVSLNCAIRSIPMGWPFFITVNSHWYHATASKRNHLSESLPIGEDCLFPWFVLIKHLEEGFWTHLITEKTLRNCIIISTLSHKSIGNPCA